LIYVLELKITTPPNSIPVPDASSMGSQNSLEPPTTSPLQSLPATSAFSTHYLSIKITNNKSCPNSEGASILATSSARHYCCHTASRNTTSARHHDKSQTSKVHCEGVLIIPYPYNKPSPGSQSCRCPRSAPTGILPLPSTRHARPFANS